jgi:hypothetical protein
MAIYPGAVVRLKPHQQYEGPIAPRVVILHSICGGYKDPGLAGLANLLDVANPLESQFAVDADGTVYQLRDTEWHSDANLDANAFAISIETESSVAATEPWTPRQYAAIVDLVRWCCDTHDIPKVRAAAWDGTGIGYHTMWGAPSHWTPVSKTCPGPARIAQVPQVIEDVKAGEDLNADQDQKLTFIYQQIKGAVGPGQRDFAGTLAACLATAQGLVNLSRGNQGALAKAVTDAKSAVLGALAATPTVHLVEADQAEIARQVSGLLSAQGVSVEASAVLDAMAQRLAA